MWVRTWCVTSTTRSTTRACHGAGAGGSRWRGGRWRRRRARRARGRHVRGTPIWRASITAVRCGWGRGRGVCGHAGPGCAASGSGAGCAGRLPGPGSGPVDAGGGAVGRRRYPRGWRLADRDLPPAVHRRGLRQDTSDGSVPDRLRDNAECDPAASATHRFDYSTRSARRAGSPRSVDWDTGDDSYAWPRRAMSPRSGCPRARAGQGGSIGVDPAVPSKMGSFGGSVTMDGTTTKSLVDLVDINGDGLVDKVYLEGSAVRYRLNTSQADRRARTRRCRSARPRAWSRGSRLGSGLGLERQVGIGASLEAHYGADGISRRVGRGPRGVLLHRRQRRRPARLRQRGQRLLQPAGLPVAGADRAGGGCVPRFDRDSAGTRVPVRVTSPTVSRAPVRWSTGGWPTRWRSCGRRSRRWTRCGAGSRRTPERCRSPLPRPCAAARLARRGRGRGCPRPGWAAARTGGGAGAGAGRGRGDRGVRPGPRLGSRAGWTGRCAWSVGDPVYFRFSPATASSAQEVAWSQRVDYIAVDGVADLAGVPADPEGRSTASSRGTRRSRPRVVRRWPGCRPWAPGRRPSWRGCWARRTTSDDLTFTVLRHPPLDSSTEADPAAPVAREVSVVPVTAAGEMDCDRLHEVMERDSGVDRWCVQVRGHGPGAGLRGDRGRALQAASSRLYAVETGTFGVDSGTAPAVARRAMLEARLATTSPVDPSAVGGSVRPGCACAGRRGLRCGAGAGPGAGGDLPVNTATGPRGSRTGSGSRTGTETRA